ncbi:MAG: hypothetical protein ABIG71_02835 [Candidatus Uhrbacteria bacterium]
MVTKKPREEQALLAIVLKLDGILIRTHDIIIGAYEEAFTGTKVVSAQYETILGTNPWHAIVKMAKLHGYDLAQHEVEERVGVFREEYDRHVLGNTKLIHPAAHDFLTMLRECGLRIAIVHAGNHGPALVESLGLHKAADCVVDCTVFDPMHAPPILTKLAVARLGLEPNRCCGIATTPIGIRAIASSRVCPIGVIEAIDVSLLNVAGAQIIYRDIRFFTEDNIRESHHRWNARHDLENEIARILQEQKEQQES